MRTIAVMNQKGGVGKTTTSVNLAAGLAARGRKVCLIDLDPQGHASMHLGIEATGSMPTIYQVLAGEKYLAEVRHLVAPNLWVVPANIELAAIEMELANISDRELILREALQQFATSQPLDYIVIDCPPSLGVLTINALTAVKEVFIPLQPHFFALQGLSKLLETTARVTRRLNRELKVSGVVICLFETGTRLASDVIADLTNFLRASDANAPWANARIFQTKVRRNIKLAEAPSFGQSIFDYEPKSAGAQDYLSIIEEVIAMESAGSVPQAA